MQLLIKFGVPVIHHYGLKNHGESDLQFVAASEGPKGSETKRQCGASL